MREKRLAGRFVEVLFQVTRQSRGVRLKMPWRMTETPGLILANVTSLTAPSLDSLYAEGRSMKSSKAMVANRTGGVALMAWATDAVLRRSKLCSMWLRCLSLSSRGLGLTDFRADIRPRATIWVSAASIPLCVNTV